MTDDYLGHVPKSCLYHRGVGEKIYEGTLAHTSRSAQGQSGFLVFIPTPDQYAGTLHYGPRKSYLIPPLVPQGMFSVLSF